MANRFWIGGTGTWDSSTTTQWSTITGGLGGASVPGANDSAVFDANSGGGTVTADATLNGTSLQSIVAGAFTGTLDFSVNNPNLTFTGTSTVVNFSGTGARKYLLGSGTWTLSGAGAAVFDIGTTTNLDPTSDTTCPIVFSANTASERQFNGGGRTFGTLTIAANTGRGGVRIFSANTFSSITVAAGTSYLMLPASTTTTISGSAGLVLTGSSTNPMVVLSSTVNSGTTTLSLSSGTSTPTWTAFMGVTTTGSGTLTATNSFDLGRNTLDTGDTITAPSGGGGTTVGVIG
jgi:hypothetical protein